MATITDPTDKSRTLESGTYDVPAGQVVLEGNVVLTRDENVIRGANALVTDEPYFKVSDGDAWFVMEGQMGVSVEGLGALVANPGDIVYVPAGRFEQPSHLGGGFSTGIVINGYPRGSRHFPETQPPVPPLASM